MLRQTFTARTPLRTVAFALLCAVLVAFFFSGAAKAENTVPDNATANSYNTGWKCDDGFQERTPHIAVSELHQGFVVKLFVIGRALHRA